MTLRRRDIVLAAAGAGALPRGMAQPAYPSRPVTLVVPFPAGGSQDGAARLIGKRLQEELGQPVVVENKPGAGGGIGVQAVVSAAPDGHTLLITSNGPLAIIPHLYKTARYTAADLAPIAMLFTAPFFVTVPAQSPYRTAREWLDSGKVGAAGAPMYGSTGSGNASHVVAEMINVAAGTKFPHVPYKGGAPLTTALIAGETAWALQMAVDSKPFVDAGKLRPLAVLSAKRSAPWPDVPTLAELGIRGVDYGSWSALLAPAKTPRPIIDLLNRKIRKILLEPEVAGKLHALAAEPGLPTNTPERLGEIIAAESRAFRQAITDANVHVD